MIFVSSSIAFISLMECSVSLFSIRLIKSLDWLSNCFESKMFFKYKNNKKENNNKRINAAVMKSKS